MNEKRRLIEDIKNEYLIEKEKKQTTIKSMWSQYQKMARELSEGIYSEDNHFIYEIIQNAEDTKCNEKKHILEFFLEKDGLLIFNNEVGFKEDEIKAICAFGESTKAKDKNKGYIGEKGIGFKSVFKITDNPAINSNGYRFYFKRKDEKGNTEYIIPYWIDDNEIKNYPIRFQQNHHTALYLPFRKDKKEESIKKLKDNIKDIEPIILLFLKELSKIKIFDNNKEIINVIKTKSKSEKLDLVSITNGTQKNKYYLFKRDIIIDKPLDETKKDGKRENVKKREIILAFPDFKNKQKEDRLFSFLPTKLYTNLNFIIQADFILQSGRENISIDSEWNKFQIEKIEDFIVEEIIDKLKLHSKLKYIYLDYFIRDYESNNELIDNLYENILSKIKSMPIILTDKESWELPNNIILLEDDIKIDTKYLKLLFRYNYEQVHPKFHLDEFFIDKFNIKKVNKEDLLNKILQYVDRYNELNDYDTDDIFYLTKIISKYLNFGRDGRKFDENYLKKIKKSLPIIPKYKTDKKFYLYDSIYISSEYKPKFLIENIAKEDEFDFTQYNFLSDDYLEKKRLTDFIKNIIDEQEKDKNKKTIEFFTKYPNILQNYLRNNINNYKKVFNFLIEIQEDNKNKISEIPLLLTQKGEFYNSTQTIYFSNDSDSDLNILDKNLLNLVQSEIKYKEFLEKVFKVKEADILNIILNEYLPWTKQNYYNRTAKNDTQLLKYTKDIIENFYKFEKEDKDKIKQSLFFISSNQKEKYLKSNNIYLTQNLAEIIFNDNSIEKYIIDKSFFDFLDGSYNEIFKQIDEEKTKEFIKYFSFEKNIKEDDIQNFIKFIKTDLDLDSNIEALEFIAKSIDYEDRKKIKEIENFKIYSQRMNLIEIKNTFQDKIDDLEIDYLHSKYKKKIGDSYFNNIKYYFQSEYKIEPFIEYLKQDIEFDEAIKVYEYLDSKNEHNPNKTKKSHYSITTEKIRKEFKNSKLIYSKDKKYYPTEVTWKEEKSNNQLFALSTIYPQELQNFFIKKVQVSQTKEIRQIITQIKEIKEKNDNYFDLLIDLNDLVSDDSEIEKYYKSFDRNKPSVKNKYEDMRKFILEKEQIFILDNGKKNKDDNFYFNDLGIDDYDENLENKIFTVNDKYPIEHYTKLIDTLNVKRLSRIEKSYVNRKFIEYYDIQDYRLMLNFAYDLIFTKFPDEYKKIEDRETDLKELNEINIINIHQDIISQIKLDDILIEIDEIKYYFSNNKLFIVNKNDLFKIIAEKIDFISDKDIKDFYNEVIKGNKNKKQYYKSENIREKQNFMLEISDKIIENNKLDRINLKEDELDVFNDKRKLKEVDNIQLSAEEERKQRRQKSGVEQVKGYNKNVSNHQNEISLSTVKDTQERQEQYIREKEEKLQKTSNNSTKLFHRTKEKTSKITPINYKVGEEETKDFFRRKDQYLGQCQICGFTFTTKNGINYCERFTWSDYKRVKVKPDLIDAGNSLCLCAKCHSIIKGGGDFEATFLTDEILEYLEKDDYDFDTFLKDLNSNKPINPPEGFKEHLEFDDIYFVDIRLNNKNERIYFTEEHLLMFFEFLKNG